jgi:peptidoglycan/xylan/chitin deacetylase (PgdA/CDA1 family)
VLDEEMRPDAPASVVLTFDDGHVSNWSLALPLLLDAGFTATFYVVVGRVDKDPECLTTGQLRELAEQGMHIGSHTMTHRFLPELAEEEIRRELIDSRLRLEDLLGRPVPDLALPGGHMNRATLRLARDCGYRSVATARVGLYRSGEDPFRIPRLEIRRKLPLDQFRRTFRAGKLRQLQAFELGKACLRRSLGLSRYTALRRFAHRFAAIKR